MNGRLVRDRHVALGTVVVIRPLKVIVYAGPYASMPESLRKETNVLVHVHPALFDKIQELNL